MSKEIVQYLDDNETKSVKVYKKSKENKKEENKDQQTDNIDEQPRKEKRKTKKLATKSVPDDQNENLKMDRRNQLIRQGRKLFKDSSKEQSIEQDPLSDTEVVIEKEFCLAGLFSPPAFIKIKPDPEEIEGDIIFD